MRPSTVLLGAALALFGCYQPPARAPIGAPPPTPAEVATCRRELAVRNWGTILGSAFGGSSSLTGGVATDVSDSRTKLGLQIGAASAAAVALGLVLTAAVENNAYGAGRCDQVLAP